MTTSVTPTRTVEHPANGAVLGVLVTTALVVLTQLYAAIPLTAPVGAALGGKSTFALSTAFSLCYAAGFLLWGPLADQYGHKPIMTIGLTGLTLATLGCGFAASLPALAILRAIQGLMAASFAPVALAHLAEATAPRRRSFAIGAMSTAFLVAGIAGQVIASALSLTFGWASVFWCSTAALAACLFMIARVVVEPARAVPTGNLGHRFTAIGRVAVRPAVLLLCAGHLTLLLSFVAMYAGLGAHLTELGLVPSQAIWLRLFGLPGMLASLCTGRLAQRIGMAGVARVGFGISALGLAGESALSGTLAGTAIASLVFVTGIALTVPAMIHLFGESAAPNRAGGMAVNGFVLFLGASLGPLIVDLHWSFPTLLIALAALQATAALCLGAHVRLDQRDQTRGSA